MTAVTVDVGMVVDLSDFVAVVKVVAGTFVDADVVNVPGIRSAVKPGFLVVGIS